jgi:hypothetical protein
MRQDQMIPKIFVAEKKCSTYFHLAHSTVHPTGNMPIDALLPRPHLAPDGTCRSTNTRAVSPHAHRAAGGAEP